MEKHMPAMAESITQVTSLLFTACQKAHTLHCQRELSHIQRGKVTCIFHLHGIG